MPGMNKWSRKVGRNDPCPCGSGKKFKKCHGGLEIHGRDQVLPPGLLAAISSRQALETQRVRQQGLGRPIIAAEFKGYRFVAVKNRLLYGKQWRTFHDFLMEYIKMALGPDWGNAEIARPFDDRHPIMQWYQLVCDFQRRTIPVQGEVSSAAVTGAVGAYLSLAYDLFALDHNAELQERLMARLRDRDNFLGARYEVRVAAHLIRAGFELEFEDEGDGTTTHCEFTATYLKTGKKFSVEAKHSGAGPGRLIRQLGRALAKQANHTRVVFIEANAPDDGSMNPPPVPLDALRRLRRFEETDPNSQHLPPAYVFVTNEPWTHHLDSTGVRLTMVADGFRIIDFKRDTKFPTLREAIDARSKHREMHALIASVGDHSTVPATFDGEIPEFAFGDSSSRLLIGKSYEVRDESGSPIVGRLTSAVVVEADSSAVCAFQLPDGRTILSTVPLSPEEMEAWRRHPDTFFGVIAQRKTRFDDPVELYEMQLEVFSKTPRERLLEFLAGAPDLEQLEALDQPALASVYVERLVSHMWNMAQVPPGEAPKA